MFLGLGCRKKTKKADSPGHQFPESGAIFQFRFVKRNAE